MKPNDVPITERELLSVPDAAKLLSMHPGTVYRLIAEGHIPTVQIGSTRRVPRRALQALAEGPKAAPRTVTSQKALRLLRGSERVS